MDHTVRHIRPDELSLIEDFLFEAIFLPEGFEGELDRTLIQQDPKCVATYDQFGKRPDDMAVVCKVEGRVVGACWVRTTDVYGHIDDDTPAFAIALLAPFRGKGLGTEMMRTLLDELKGLGYRRTSLSVQKQNPALRLYERLGFRIIGEGADDSEWLMVRDL